VSVTGKLTGDGNSDNTQLSPFMELWGEKRCGVKGEVNMSKPISGTFQSLCRRGRPGGLALPAPAGFNLIIYGIAGLVAVLSAALLAVLASMVVAFPGGYPDPFAPYALLVPGESRAILASYPCQPQWVPASLGMSVCHIDLGSENFSGVTVYTQNGTVQRVEFGIERLQVVDLARSWGRPDEIKRSRRQYILVWWGAGLLPLCTARRQFSYQLPLDLRRTFGAS
jgi:hypothetical protein